MKRERAIVITTVFPKSEAISAFEKQPGWRVIVVGDKKTPPIPSSSDLTYLSVEEQAELDFRLPALCPHHHYSRKNIGYLYAMQQGAETIFDTDDDNFPYPGWEPPDFSCDRIAVSSNKFVNVYSHFTAENIWPRGFPLDEISKARQNPLRVEKTPPVQIGVWQGLTDEEPDADAIYWLTVGKKIVFEKKEPLYLPPGRICPVNSQNSLWRRDTFPYLYLPVTVPFRFTDVLRGYIAQVLMSRQGFHVGFTGATLRQERNPHDLMKDAAEEFHSHIRIKRILEIIEQTETVRDPGVNLENVYRRLAEARLVQAGELRCLEAWIGDYRSCLDS